MKILSNDIIIIILLVMIILLFAVLQYGIIKCPQNKILVVTNKKNKKVKKVIQGGNVIINPLIEKVTFLDMEPFMLSINLRKLLSKDKLSINIDSKFIVGISANIYTIEKAIDFLINNSKTNGQNSIENILCENVKEQISYLDKETVILQKNKLIDIMKYSIEGPLNNIGYTVINIAINKVV
ncbi:SPFH domain-containing protein [Fusobacterium sp. PH5-44]|uniref:SPFH domain-containing protein n=1 Tax=unclassified Fusobacterium TaxID=2648384 RepID=UPI003D1C35B8